MPRVLAEDEWLMMAMSKKSKQGMINMEGSLAIFMGVVMMLLLMLHVSTFYKIVGMGELV